ncbi:hypothetical protein [Bacillus sp. JJ722]|uniref:hypothetical protein n=1 Tax=Bacillus sp. JJ722 TaxID=3122973 RepID=UPI003000514B
MSEPTDRKREIANAVSKIEQLGIEIWEEHDGRELESDKSKWDKHYFTELQSQLETNFSKQRFQRTLQVGRHVYKEELSRPERAVQGQPRPKVKGQGQPYKGFHSGKLLVAGLVVVAAAAAIYIVTQK